MLAIEHWDANKFWSEDFITGITAFIAQVNDGIACIEKEEQFYQWFINDWSNPLLSELGKKVQDTNLVEHEALCDLLDNFKKCFAVEQLETICLRPLQSTLKQAKRWRDEMEKVLKALYSDYSRDLKAMRDALELYNRKAEASPEAKTQQDRIVKSPIELDEHLKFIDEEALQKFLTRVKQSMPTHKKSFMDYLGIEGKSSFQGKQLMEAIKKNSSKLDTSPFNLDRLGQRLLDLDVVREDAIALTTRRPFDQQAYYSWVEPSNDKQTLGNWVRGLSTISVDNVPLEVLETRYFEKCCKLEFSKYELEKAIYENLERYSKFSVAEIDHTLRKNREVFNKLYAHTKNKTNIMPPEPPIQFYLRCNRVAVVKWEINQSSLVRRMMMLGSDNIDGDAVEAIRRVLRHVESFTEETDLKKRVLKAWRAGSAMEMGRAIHLKMELIKTFRDTPDATNVKTVQALIDSNRFPVANDWIGLVKLWLLELPDSLVPPKCIEMITKHQDDSWLNEMPANNLLILQEMCQHFQWLGQEVEPEQEPISHYFMRRVDCIRNFHEDCKIFEPWLISFLTEPSSKEKLQQAISSKKPEIPVSVSPSPPAIQILDLEQSTTPPSADPDENFQPRPFRTASAASSVPGSPIPSRSSRRISGLVIEAPDQNSDASHLALN